MHPDQPASLQGRPRWRTFAEDYEIVSYNPTSAAFIENPFPFLKQLREADPIHFTRFGWVLTRYEDCAYVLKSKSFGMRGFDTFLLRSMGSHPVQRFIANRFHSFDAPDHSRLRQSVAATFKKTAIADLSDQILACARALAEPLAGRGEVDIMSAFAYPLTTNSLSAIIGVPPADIQRISAWSLSLLDYQGAEAPSDRQKTLSLDALSAFETYLSAFLPSPGARTTPSHFLTRLLDAEAKEELSRDEVVSTIIFMTNAGFSTTAKLIGNVLATLLEHPETWKKLGKHVELCQSAAEEALRHNCSLTRTLRFALNDTVISGVPIKSGDSLTCVLNAANRDPTQYDQPDRFDLERLDKRHLAFGGGPHICLGMHLARLQITVALQILSERFPNMSLAKNRIRWSPGLYRGPVALKVSVDQ